MAAPDERTHESCPVVCDWEQLGERIRLAAQAASAIHLIVKSEQDRAAMLETSDQPGG